MQKDDPALGQATIVSLEDVGGDPLVTPGTQFHERAEEQADYQSATPNADVRGLAGGRVQEEKMSRFRK